MRLKAIVVLTFLFVLSSLSLATSVAVDFNDAADVDGFIVIRDDTPSETTLGVAQNAGKGVGSVPGGGFEAVDVGVVNGNNDLATFYAPGGVAANGVITLLPGKTITMSVKFKVLHNDEAATPRLGFVSYNDATAATANWTVLDINGGKDIVGGTTSGNHADGIAVNVATGGDKTFNIASTTGGGGREFFEDPAGLYTLVDGGWYQFVLVITKLSTTGDFDVTITLNQLDIDGVSLDSEISTFNQIVNNPGLYLDDEVIAGLTIVHDGEPDSCTNEYDDFVIDASFGDLSKQALRFLCTWQ